MYMYGVVHEIQYQSHKQPQQQQQEIIQQRERIQQLDQIQPHLYYNLIYKEPLRSA